jgi:hypothetical protein
MGLKRVGLRGTTRVKPHIEDFLFHTFVGKLLRVRVSKHAKAKQPRGKVEARPNKEGEQ